MPVFNPKAGRLDSLVIKDLVTGKIYTDEEAHQQPPEIRSRLVNHYTKYGCWVMTMEEAKEALKKNGRIH
jgi:hypothetical protein